MTPLRSFVAGIILTLILVLCWSYFFSSSINYQNTSEFLHRSTGSSASADTIESTGIHIVYVAQPFAMDPSTDCSRFDLKQKAICEADLANTIFTQFANLSAEKQLTYDCTQMRVDTQQKYCEDRKLAIPIEKKKIAIFEKVKQVGVSACSELDTQIEQDRCQIDVALGRFILSTESVAQSGGLTHSVPIVSHCEILTGALETQCEMEAKGRVQPQSEVTQQDVIMAN